MFSLDTSTSSPTPPSPTPPWIGTFHETFDSCQAAREKAEERSLKFRTVFSAYAHKPRENHPLPTRDGLEALWISGSAQMKEYEIKFLRDCIPPTVPLYFVDLRREKHVYWNGEPIKPLNKNRCRSDLTKLRSEVGESAVFTKEKSIAEKYGLIPVRIKAQENDICNQENVDRFITFFDQIKGERWIHVHCAAGWNRTTTYMIAVDMLLNSAHVSKEEILLRHRCIGGDDYLVKSSTKLNRLFLDHFYLFAQAKLAGNQQTWSQYCQEKGFALNSHV